jgi:hypothetical protein
MKLTMRTIGVTLATVLVLGMLSAPAGAGKQSSPSADLSISVTESADPVLLAQELTYVATVSNAGSSDASAWVSATLKGTLLTSVSSSQGSCTSTYNPMWEETNISCNVGSLARSATARVSVISKASGGPGAPFSFGTASLTANTWGNVEDPKTSNNGDSESTTVTALPAGGGCAGITNNSCGFTSTGSPITVAGAFASAPFCQVFFVFHCGGFARFSVTVTDPNGTVLASCTGALACTGWASETPPPGTPLRCSGWVQYYVYPSANLTGAFSCTG